MSDPVTIIKKCLKRLPLRPEDKATILSIITIPEAERARQRQADLHRKINGYFTTEPSFEYLDYHNSAVIPIKYLRRVLYPLASFKRAGRNADKVLKTELSKCCKAGFLIEAPAEWALKEFNTRSSLYCVGPAFFDQSNV